MSTTHTHYIYADTPEKRDAVKDYISGRSSGYDVYLTIPDGVLLPEDLGIKPFIKNSCSRGFIRGPPNQLDNLVTKIGELGINAEVTLDTRRDHIYHFKFNDSSAGANALGTEIEFDDNNKGVIKRWLRKATSDDAKVHDYLKYLLQDNFLNDTYLQDLALIHRSWIPLQTRSSTPQGILTFKGAKKMRLTASVIHTVVATLEGGKVSDNGDFVTCKVIQDWVNADDANDADANDDNANDADADANDTNDDNDNDADANLLDDIVEDADANDADANLLDDIVEDD